MKPFRFGASIAAARSGTEWREVARRIEGWGYSTLLLPDHFVSPFAPMPALVTAAEAAPSLRVGTMVAANDFRHPAMLAKESATIDLLTHGRFELGIGAGWLKWEYDATGIPFATGGERVDRLREGLAIIKGLWGEEPVTFHGDHYWVDGLTGTPTPVQRPGPPVMIGAGARELVTLAAREADIVSLAPSFAGGPAAGVPNPESFTASGIEKRLGWLRDGAPERYEQLEISAYYAGRGAVTEDARGAAERSVAGLEQRTGGKVDLSVEEALASPMFLFGTVEQIIDDLVERRERYDISYVVVTDEMVEAFAPVVRALEGVAR